MTNTINAPFSDIVKMQVYYKSGKSVDWISDKMGYSVNFVYRQTMYFNQIFKRVVPVIFNEKRNGYYESEEQMLYKPVYSCSELRGEELEILNSIIMEKYVKIEHTEPQMGSDGVWRVNITRELFNGSKMSIAHLMGSSREEVVSIREMMLNSISNENSKVVILKAE